MQNGAAKGARRRVVVFHAWLFLRRIRSNFRALVEGGGGKAVLSQPAVTFECQLSKPAHPVASRSAPLQELGLPVNADIPMLGFIGRLGEPGMLQAMGAVLGRMAASGMLS